MNFYLLTIKHTNISFDLTYLVFLPIRIFDCKSFKLKILVQFENIPNMLNLAKFLIWHNETACKIKFKENYLTLT